MLGGAVGEVSPGGEDLHLTVTVVRDEHGYGMKVSGDNPVYVQSVKEHGAAWRAGLRAGDRILKVDSVPVQFHTHQQVVHMIRANPSTTLTVLQNSSRHKTPITGPVPVNQEKLRQLEMAKVHTMRLMLDKEQKYMRDLKNELLKVPDVRKQVELEAAQQRCGLLQHEIDSILAGQPEAVTPTTPTTPKLSRKDPEKNANMSFLSGLPRSISNLTGQSLRNLRQNRQKQETPLVRQNSDETNNKRQVLVPRTNRIPTTCLDNTPPPLPPRSTERPKRNPMSPMSPPSPMSSLNPGSPVNPLAKPAPAMQNKIYKINPMHQSMPEDKFRRSSHSLDGEIDGPQPNSIALQMSYPLVNVPPPPLQTDNRGSVPVLHVRSQSSPEHLDHDLPRTSASGLPASTEKEAWARGTPPPGTPPPPYLQPHAHPHPHPHAHPHPHQSHPHAQSNQSLSPTQGHAHTPPTAPPAQQPCADPQRAIISMEEDDPPSDNSTSGSGLFSNLRAVRESKARMAVLINWLLGERRCPCASLVLVLTDAYRAAAVPPHTRRRWAYELHSTFLAPDAILQLNGIDENMANEIDHVLVNEHDKEELLRNVFRKARRVAKEELARQLADFQLKRRLGLAALYAPDDAVLLRCDVDRAQELVVVEQLLCARLAALAAGGAPPPAAAAPDARPALLAALAAAALALDCRPASVAAAAGGARGSFLQRDKLYKQRLKQLTKQYPQPFVVRGHALALVALCGAAHCHQCARAVGGPAPQAAVCGACGLRVHAACARAVDEACCVDAPHAHTRMARFMERMHTHALAPGQDSSDKKSRKSSSTAHFLNIERNSRKMEDDPPWDATLSPAAQERRDESDESLYESADCHSDAISASDDALPRLSKTPTISKESLKLAITDEEGEHRMKKGHRKTMSLSNPIEIVKSLGDEWFDHTKKDVEKNCDKKKSRESLWSEEDRDSIHGSSMKLDQIKKNSKKEDKANESRKSSTTEAPKRKTSKGSSVSALNFLRRKKTPTSMKAVEAVVEVVDGIVNTDEILNYTKFFLEEEKRHAALCQSKPPVETDSDEDMPPPKVIGEHRRRLSRQTSRSKSKVRGKSQSVKVNTLRKSHSGTLKKGKKKSVKTPLVGRSRQTSIVEPSPLLKKKNPDSTKQNSWLFSGTRGESRREGSTEEQSAPDVDVDSNDNTLKEPEKEQSNHRSWKGGARGVNRAESCRERDVPRRGKHRNASDPNRLTAHPNHDLEPGAATAPSGSSSSSSLSSRSNESNTVAAEQQGSQSDWSEEEDPLAAQWSESLPQHIRDSIILSARIRKRQEVIHELIVSEGSHVRWLKVLGVDFLKPLERQPSLLPPEELRALFPNLPGVRERHTKLYADLRQVRNEAINHVVEIRPIADAMLNTLGEAGYAPCLSRFCSGQRMALEALRERRRKNKDLHQFLAGREQLPRCGRLQLRDLLACVWQRLTKYQLLLESILKTTGSEGAEGAEADAAEDVAQLRRALAVAKDVLHSVDTAIRTQENYHRLCTIQDKIEVRIPNGAEGFEELRKLDLAAHSLRLEGDLNLRTDNKKIRVLALMLEDSLVLLQKEGEKFILRPLAQPGHSTYLTPIIKWDKVLFRPNAAVRNTFFLMNINSVQMHELSANTAAEYATWVKHIQEAPLVRLAEAKTLTPAHQHARSADDTATVNVSRNPSDASEKSTSSAPPDTCERERERASTEREENEKEREMEKEREIEKEKEEREERAASGDKDTEEDSLKHKAQQPAVGRISTHAGAPPPAAARAEVRAASVHTAARAFSHHERLRRLDEAISRALKAKSAVVAELLGVPPHAYTHLAELAVADTLGHVDICGELNAPRESEPAPDVHQLLLAAQAQANQLSEALSAALSLPEAGVVAARAGRCDACRRRAHAEVEQSDKTSDLSAETQLLESSVLGVLEEAGEEVPARVASAPAEPAYGVAGAAGAASAAELATRLAAPLCGLQAALAALLGAPPPPLRAELAAARDRADALRRRLCDARAAAGGTDYQMTEEIFQKGVDQSIQEQPSNGG